MFQEDIDSKDEKQDKTKSNDSENTTPESDGKTETVKENQITNETISKLVTLYLENH
jgi:hypothetical protein